MQCFTALSRLTISEMSLLLFSLNLFLVSHKGFFILGLRGAVIICTSFMVGLHIETHSPTVSLNYLLAVAIMKTR